LNDTIAAKNYVQVEIKNFIDTPEQSISKKLIVYDDSYFIDLELSLRHRSILRVCVVNKDSILINDDFQRLEGFKEIAKEFVSNPTDREDYSEHRQINIDLLGTVRVPKGVLSIRTLHGYYGPMSIIDWELFFRIINCFNEAYLELRSEFAIAKWNIEFDELEFNRRVALTKMYPTNIELNFMRNCRSPVSLAPINEIDEILDIVDED